MSFQRFHAMELACGRALPDRQYQSFVWYSGIHWVIAGGESGPGARPVRAEWLRSIRDTCRTQTVAFFFKQWGGRTPKSGGNKLDGSQWLEYPSTADLDRLGASRAVAGAPPVDDRVEKAMEVGPWAQEKRRRRVRLLPPETQVSGDHRPA